MKRRTTGVSTALYLILGTLAIGQEAIPSFVDTEAFDFLAIVPEPPGDDSVAGRADLETVLQLQKDRTPLQLERVRRVADKKVFSFAGAILGPAFREENLPYTALFFHEVTQESYTITKRAKRHWARERPYWRDPSIIPFPRASRSQAYPSGHVGDAATWIVILEALFPEHTGAFDDALREVMWCRVLGASHYPTDTQAGKILGRAVGIEMLKSPAMSKALARVRAELQTVGLIAEAGPEH